MRGYCRFLRTKGGRSYFARVWLEVLPGGETVKVVDALPESVDPDAGEVNRHTAPGWVAAALEGIRATLAYAQQTGVLVTGCSVALEKMVGSVVDTRDDVVRCAAGLAVWDALGSPGLAPEADFDGQGWKLVFPTRVPGPAQGIAQ
jgi:hypothetical protein